MIKPTNKLAASHLIQQQVISAATIFWKDLTSGRTREGAFLRRHNEGIYTKFNCCSTRWAPMTSSSVFIQSWEIWKTHGMSAMIVYLAKEDDQNSFVKEHQKGSCVTSSENALFDKQNRLKLQNRNNAARDMKIVAQLKWATLKESLLFSVV